MAELTYTVTIESNPITLTLNKGTDGLTPYIGENGNWWIGLIDTGVKAEANSIESVELLSKVGLVATYRITFTDDTHFDYTVSDGSSGAPGAAGKSAYQSYLDTTTDNPPLSESAWANLFGSKLDIDGDGSTVTSDSSDSADPNMDFPSQGTLWNLSAWFSLIKAKINFLFHVKPSVLTVTATKVGDVITYNMFSDPEFNNSVTGTEKGKSIKIHFILSAENEIVLVNTYYDGNYNIKTGAIDCPDLARSFALVGDDQVPTISVIDGYVYTDGNGSNTTVDFVEASGEALPSTGETQSTLWGKVLRYFKTEIPALLNAKISIQGGDATNAESASNASMTYNQTWPTYVTKWSLLNWFGAIRAKIDYLFNVSSKMLYVTASRPTSTDEWTFNAFSTIEFASISSKAYLGIPIIVRFAGTTNGVAEPIMLYPGLWNETLSQITSRDLARGFYLNGGVAANRGARSYDTQKYIDLGATFNNTTGYYEYLGLTDITEVECREAYYLTGCKFAAAINFYGYGSLKTRFLFPLTNSSTSSTLVNAFNGATGIQRVRLCKNLNIADGANNLYISGSIMADMCSNNSSVRYISGGINVTLITSASNLVAFTNTNMMHVFLYNLKVNVSFASSADFDEASVLCAIVNRANGTTNITITLHATAYAMAMASSSIQAALVGSYITLASA